MFQPTIESILHEKRSFPPSLSFRLRRIKSMEDYQALYDAAAADPEGFWGDLAEKELEWFQKWDKILDWNPRQRNGLSVEN